MIRFVKSVVQSVSLLIVLSGSTAASAAPNVFDGNWLGKGTYVLNGDITQCSLVDFRFSIAPGEVTFLGGRRVCDKHEEEFYPVTMQYHDGKVFFAGEVVGTYDGNQMEVSSRVPDGATYRNWRMTMRRQGEHLMYEESRTMDGQTTPMISFAGIFLKAP
jgi:hypothetical protein